MSFFDKLKEGFQDLAADSKHITSKIGAVFESDKHSHTHNGHHCHDLHQTIHNRYHSFAPPRSEDKAKWFVDGCGYFWAMSVALEEAKTEIWIMDWWLSPELYLRRPPSKNEDYRLDRLLKAAAERGVRVNIMVYKEVEAALSLASVHTKHTLEALHPNIAVFRHPDHNPSGRGLASDFKNMYLNSHDLAKLSHAGKEALYGLSDDVVLYWAHHEKLCVIDGKVAFMGGLDACFGRWDTNDHPIADAHPSNLDDIIFPGQDFNNARVLDFAQVDHWESNKLDRTKDCRMGWSDLSICLEGSIVEDIRAHFLQRWNYLYDAKYTSVGGDRYHRLTMGHPSAVYEADGKSMYTGVESEKLAGSHANAEPDPDMPVAPGAMPTEEDGEHHLFHHRPGGFIDRLEGRLHEFSRFGSHEVDRELGDNAGVSVQLVRSAARWSHGIETEHSIANAYIEVIRNSEHFIYIENQFFITATSHEQSPVLNKIGAALVDRILIAARANEKFKVIVAMPAVPAFAGDLHAESSLGTLAIMDFQYKSISRGGHSIIETINDAGYNASNYISFYNLRSYDRINTSSQMAQAEQQSGVSYEAARKEHDDAVGAGFDGKGEGTEGTSQYAAYQEAAPGSGNGASSHDSVSSSYMLHGPPISSIPWPAGSSPESEIDAFVSEELYIHSKILIADDRLAIIGSANLNDRSQLGYHDSEIAVVVEDTAQIESTMNGEPHNAARFAASLRRQLFRKHLGLLPHQDPATPDDNFLPVDKAGNKYDWGSEEDRLVEDPLSEAFEELWSGVAKTNTEVFERVFRVVPSNAVRNWDQYQDYYAKYFVSPSPPDKKPEEKEKPIYQYGHVFKENFPGGVGEVKAELQKVRGTLVEMPLLFLDEIKNLAKAGLSYNSLTDDLYT